MFCDDRRGCFALPCRNCQLVRTIKKKRAGVRCVRITFYFAGGRGGGGLGRGAACFLVSVVLLLRLLRLKNSRYIIYMCEGGAGRGVFVVVEVYSCGSCFFLCSDCFFFRVFVFYVLYFLVFFRFLFVCMYCTCV